MASVHSVVVDIDKLEPQQPFKEFLTYWQRLLVNGAFAPSWGQFQLLDLPSELIPNITVVDVRVDPMDFIYRFWGTGHQYAKMRDYTGRSVNEIDPPMLAEAIFRQYEKTAQERQPIGFVRTVEQPGGSGPVTQGILRVPLSSNGEDIDHIVSYSSWENGEKLREFHKRNTVRGLMTEEDNHAFGPINPRAE